MSTPRILIISNDPEALQEPIEETCACSPLRASSRENNLHCVSPQDCDLILLDTGIPDLLALIRKLGDMHPESTLILFGTGLEETPDLPYLMESVYDFLEMPCPPPAPPNGYPEGTGTQPSPEGETGFKPGIPLPQHLFPHCGPVPHHENGS